MPPKQHATRGGTRQLYYHSQSSLGAILLYLLVLLGYSNHPSHFALGFQVKRTGHFRVPSQLMTSGSTSADGGIGQADNEVAQAKEALRNAIMKRRQVVAREALKLPPRQAFEVRLEQLMLEHPEWDTSIRDEDEDDSTTIYIQNFDRCYGQEKEFAAFLGDDRFDCFCQSSFARAYYINTCEPFCGRVKLHFYDSEEIQEGANTEEETNQDEDKGVEAKTEDVQTGDKEEL